MSGSKAKQLSSLFVSISAKKKPSNSSSSNSLDPVIETLTEFLPSSNSSPLRASSKIKLTFNSSIANSAAAASHSISPAESVDKALLKSISSIVVDSISRSKSKIKDLPASEAYEEDASKENVLEIPWFSTKFSNNVSVRRKEVSRDRKNRWIFKNTQKFRFDRLVAMCGEKLGTEATLKVFGKLGRETGVKEYNALIRLCIDKARLSDDEEAALDHIHNAYQLFKGMREQGIIVGNYLLALCENDKKEELLQLLKIVDITKTPPLEFVPSIFKSLGRLLLEDHAEKTISAFKASEIGAENISYFIWNYVINMPNQLVEDVIPKFNSLHEKLDVTPSSKSFEKLIENFCDSAEVHAALSVIDEICRLGLPLSSELFNPILQAVEENCEFELHWGLGPAHTGYGDKVNSIYDAMRRHDLNPNGEMFRCMINLRVKMKDFQGAYNMLADMKILGMEPTASIYNCILAGYFREAGNFALGLVLLCLFKNIHAALKIVDQMKSDSVEPDSQTFSYLICNCECEEDIIKYYEEMRNARVRATKQVYMSLINAYANCGQFEKAKQVLGEQGIPVKNINEIKSVLVSVLSSSEHLSDALEIYDEDNLHCEGNLDRMLQLLGELSDLDFWLDGCSRVVSYCIRHENLCAVVELLKQIKDKNAAFTKTVLEQMATEDIELDSNSKQDEGQLHPL
ncbi:hypothetical protein Syun_010213 [Stephania yunnanensis]|uniref:PROP1-like PPR domain-containing protein n=1 Tax=Stephania yunnanensis TaxID=152371 RepID=A0AAP0KI83_9MAGN